MTIPISKQGGEIKNLESLSKQINVALKTLSNGEFTLTITRRKTKRSVEQNSLMWMWFNCIENETGTPKQDVHDYCCRAFNFRVVEINGKQEKVAGGTSKLTTVTMTNFLTKVQAWASSELGIILPNPDDLEFEQFKNYYKQFYF